MKARFPVHGGCPAQHRRGCYHRTVVRILISAGEASGDMYAAQLARALRPHFPIAQFYGCAGPRLKEAGVEVVIDSASLAVSVWLRWLRTFQESTGSTGVS